MTAALLILWLLLFSVAPAEAAFLLPFIAPALVGTFAGAVVSAGITLAVSFGLSYVASKLLTKASTDDTADVGGAQLNVKAAADIPYSLIVGRAVTAGSRVYTNTGGTAPSASKNAHLIEIIALADHPCHRLAGVFIAGLPAALTDLAGAVEGANVEGWAGTIGELTKDEYFSKFGLPPFGGSGMNGAAADGITTPANLVDYEDKLHIRFYDGAQTAADPLAVSITADSDQSWPSTAIGHGVTYARLHSIYDGEKVTGPLEWKFVVDGVKLYDPRKDTTVGGSGSHAWGNQSTYEWTDNVAVIIYNIVRGIYGYGNEFFFGIEGTTADQLPLDIWFAAMNECDVTVEIEGGGTEKQFTAGGEITVDTQPLDAITALLKACGGRFVEIGGIYKLYVGAPGVPTLTFADGDIRANQADTFNMVLPLEQRINYVTGKYTSPDDGWIDKIAPAHTYAPFVAEDGRRLPSDLNAAMVQTNGQMQRLQWQLLQRARRERKHVIPLPPIGLQLEPGDVFLWNSARNGYVDKLFEIDGIDYDGNLNTTVSCTEVDHADYDWSADMALPVIPGQIVVKYPDAKVIAGFSAEPYTYLGDDGTAAPAIKLLWDNPNDPDATSILWQLRVTAVPDNFTSGSSDDVPAGALIIVGGLQPLTAYQVRARFGSSAGYASEWSLWIDVTTLDIRISLADLEQHITDLVTAEFDAATDAMDAIAEQIAAAVAEQDAQNWLEQAAAKGDLVVNNVIVSDKIAANTAKVETLAASVVTNEGAFATYQADVTAKFDTTNAQVQLNATSIATTSTALASYQVTTDASLGGLSASVTTNQTAIATIDGKLAAQWTVVLDVNGYVSSVKAYNDGSVSGWTFVGNVFQVAFPGVSGGAPVPVFQVSNVSGSPKVAIRADVIADGTITATKMVTGTITAVSAIIADAAIATAKIQDAAIQTAKIANLAVQSAKIADLNVTTLKVNDNAITFPKVTTESSAVFGTASLVVSDINCEDTIAGKPIMVFASVTFALGYGGGFQPWTGTLVIETPAGSFNVATVTGNAIGEAGVALSGGVTYTPPAGGTIFFRAYLQWNPGSGTMQINARTLVMQTTKR